MILIVFLIEVLLLLVLLRLLILRLECWLLLTLIHILLGLIQYRLGMSISLLLSLHLLHKYRCVFAFLLIFKSLLIILFHPCFEKWIFGTLILKLNHISLSFVYCRTLSRWKSNLNLRLMLIDWNVLTHAIDNFFKNLIYNLLLSLILTYCLRLIFFSSCHL